MSSATQNCALSICEQCMLKLIYGTLNYILNLQFEVCLFVFVVVFSSCLLAENVILVCRRFLYVFFSILFVIIIASQTCFSINTFIATSRHAHWDFFVYFHFVIMSYLKNSTKFRQKFDQLSIQPNVFWHNFSHLLHSTKCHICWYVGFYKLLYSMNCHIRWNGLRQNVVEAIYLDREFCKSLLVLILL